MGTVGGMCKVCSGLIEYHIVAFILQVTDSLIAVSYNTLSVLLTVVLSALLWEFLFIQHDFKFNVSTVDDTILRLMYFVIAMVNTVLTCKIRRVQKESPEREERAGFYDQ